jgi:hypothetical protein
VDHQPKDAGDQSLAGRSPQIRLAPHANRRILVQSRPAVFAELTIRKLRRAATDQWR